MENLSIAIKTFNERVRTMDQTHSKSLSLSAAEARSLHSDIFALLANIAELASKPTEVVVSGDIMVDGGKF